MPSKASTKKAVMSPEKNHRRSGTKARRRRKQAAEQRHYATARERTKLARFKGGLEAARDLFNPAGRLRTRAQDGSWLDRLASLPRSTPNGKRSARRSADGRAWMKSFLDKWTGKVTARTRSPHAPRRRAVSPADDENRGKRTRETTRARGGTRAAGRRGRRRKGASQSNLPGSEPGKSRARRLASVFSGSATQIKGLLGAGASSAVVSNATGRRQKRSFAARDRFFIPAPGLRSLSQRACPRSAERDDQNYFYR